MNTFVYGDYRTVRPPINEISLMIADPVYESLMVNDIIRIGKWPSIVFCAVVDLYTLPARPAQVAFWQKPSSTKNTTKSYSQFQEAITFWGDIRFHQMLHWSTRTGIFTDTLIDNTQHPWKKPESLIEKLVRSHYPGHGAVYDPCAGSGTVHTVCKRLGIPSFSVELDPKYGPIP